MSDAPLTVGTAGHIDHGKTRLVEALTGTDTDRLPDEKRRGISIELGYAELVLPSGRPLSLIDVPGHERLVRTMVAGAAGIDLFLLAIDAREGPRPQTYEHLRVLELLGVDQGVVAVTKIDVAEPAQVAEALRAASELVPGAEAVAVSARTSDGLPELLAALERAASASVPIRRADAARLYVDRVFSLPGAGTVATGTLRSGRVSLGDMLEILPGGGSARVRSIQVHGREVEEVEGGQRVALGLVLERRSRLERRSLLATPGRFRASYRLDVVLIGLGEVPEGARVQVCHGTSAVSARFVRAGSSYAQLRLDLPIAAARDDRVVLRLETTVGGGRVLDPQPPRHADAARIERLDVGTPAELLAAVVSAPVRVETLQRSGLFTQADLEDGLGTLVREGPWVFSSAWFEETRRATAARLAARGAEPDPGLPAGALLGQGPWAGAVAPLLGLDSIGGKLYLPSQRPAQVGETAAATELERELAEAGLAGVRIEDAELARRLEYEGRLVRLGDGLAVSTVAYDQAKAVLVAECERAGTIALARFRDLLGTSRRTAQLLLERFDVDRVTLRIGDARRLRRAVPTR